MILAFILSFLCAISYCITYWSNPFPPTGDIISPLVLFLMSIGIFFSVQISISMVFILFSLLFDTVADYVMDEDNLDLPICLFSCGHLFRQFSFLLQFYPHGSFTILILTTIVVIRTILNYSILNYAVIIGLTFVNVTISLEFVSWGLVLFIISDLIILYELVSGQIKCRPFRVILVPVLFWTAEALIIYEFI